MLNYIWLGMLAIGFVIGILNGRVDAVTKAAVDSAQDAVSLSIKLLGVMCLWTGLMSIAEKSGLVKIIARVVRPLMQVLFPEVPRTHPAMGAMVMNLVANLFGLGNAATPLGLKAMNELQKLNPNKETASNSMSMFLVLNTSVLQLIPATVIAVRAAAGSENPTEIIVPIWVATFCACLTGITVTKMFMTLYQKRRLK
jgi:spore maturation protein A